MEQILIFLTEYAGIICQTLGILTVIFLGITLHRIKRIEQELYRQDGNVKMYFENSGVELSKEMKQAAVSDPASKSDGPVQTITANTHENVKPHENVKKEEPETLINAVLEEIFP